MEYYTAQRTKKLPLVDEILKFKKKEARHSTYCPNLLNTVLGEAKHIYGVRNQDGSLRNRIQVVTRKGTRKILGVQVYFFFKM